MKWLLATAGLVILLMFPLLPSGIAAPVGDGRLPGVADAMLKADFWLAKLSSPRQVVLEPAGIVAFNRAIVQALPQVVEDLDGFPLAVDRAVCDNGWRPTVCRAARSDIQTERC